MRGKSEDRDAERLGVLDRADRAVELIEQQRQADAEQQADDQTHGKVDVHAR